MAWTPPKKGTWILSWILMIIGLLFFIEVYWQVMGLYAYLPTLTFFAPTLSSDEVWVIIALVLIFLAWFLMVLGVRVRGL